jgi:hypothetical protein
MRHALTRWVRGLWPVKVYRPMVPPVENEETFTISVQENHNIKVEDIPPCLQDRTVPHFWDSHVWKPTVARETIYCSRCAWVLGQVVYQPMAD